MMTTDDNVFKSVFEGLSVVFPFDGYDGGTVVRGGAVFTFRVGPLGGPVTVADQVPNVGGNLSQEDQRGRSRC